MAARFAQVREGATGNNQNRTAHLEIYGMSPSRHGNLDEMEAELWYAGLMGWRHRDPVVHMIKRLDDLIDNGNAIIYGPLTRPETRGGQLARFIWQAPYLPSVQHPHRFPPPHSPVDFILYELDEDNEVGLLSASDANKERVSSTSGQKQGLVDVIQNNASSLAALAQGLDLILDKVRPGDKSLPPDLEKDIIPQSRGRFAGYITGTNAPGLVGISLADGSTKRIPWEPATKTVSQITTSSADDDVQAGSLKLSLRDPLSMTRIEYPGRGKKCVHAGCFDAKMWFELKTWKTIRPCPHCSCRISFSDVMIDGYVAEILDKVPSNVDHVVVEPNGDWHTEDGKFGSAGWLRDKRSGESNGEKGGMFTAAVAELLRNLASPAPPPSPLQPQREVIDLTLDSDEEDTAPFDLTRRNLNTKPPLKQAPTAATPAPLVPRQTATEFTGALCDLERILTALLGTL